MLCASSLPRRLPQILSSQSRRGAGPPPYVDSRQPNGPLPLGALRRLESGTSENYDALQLRAEKRYPHRLTFHGNFNYQKAISIGYSVNENGLFDANYAQDPRNRNADYGRRQSDQRGRFVFIHIWEFRWLRNAKGLTGGVLAGWAVNGTVQLSSGLPVSVAQTGDSQNRGAATVPRPNIDRPQFSAPFARSAAPTSAASTRRSLTIAECRLD